MFSLLDSTIRPEQLIDKIKNMGQTAIALTDHGNTFGSVWLHKLCQKNNIKFIYGTEAYICDDVTIKERKRYHLVLLAKNETGRQNLNKLLTEAKTKHFYYVPRIDFDVLQEYKDGLIVLSACMGGELQRYLANKEYELAKTTALKYKNAFGEDYYIEIQSHSDPMQQKLNCQLVKLAKELGIEWVATTDAHYLNKDEQELHSIFVQVSQERDAGEVYTDCYIQDEKDIMRLLSKALSKEDIEKAIQNTVKIADKCNVVIPLSPPQIPHVSVPNKFKNEVAYLKHLCNQGWKRRGIHELPNQEQYRERLYYEMDAIERMGFAGYYLLVHSYANSVTRRGIARGSGGGSLVAYLINIIDIDPVKYGLYFERFIDVGQLELIESGQLKPEEIKVPDFDSDFGCEDREKVIDFVVSEYGKEKVACLGSFQYIWAKTAIKDIGKVLGIPFSETNTISKELDWAGYVEDIPDSMGDILSAWESKYPKLFMYARQLTGLPKSFSKHPCGKVIAMKDLTYYCPLSEKKGEMTLELDMKDAESLGLVKVDALALRTVDVIYDTLDAIGKDYEYINPQKIDFVDQNVLTLFRNGHTTGIFQFESDGMIEVLSKMQPTVFDDIAVANALFRPGSLRYIDNYVDRKHGKEEFEYLHDDLKEILGVTYGIIVFQEQLIEIGRLAGLRNPDIIRKATGKKDAKLMARVEPELRAGLYKRGWTKEQVDTLWKTMIEFSRYSFNKSHSYAYSMIAYISAYLKFYHPLEFITALINSYADKLEGVPKCVLEAKRLGIEVIIAPQHVSSGLCEVINGKIVLGSKLIKFCNEQNAQDLMRLGEHEYFVDLLVDIKENTSIDSRQLRIFIMLNVFQKYGGNAKLLKILAEFESGTNRYDKKHKPATKEIRLPLLREFERLLPDETMNINEQARAEQEYLGFITTTYQQIDESFALVLSIYINPKYPKYSPRITVHHLKNGIERAYRMEREKYFYNGNPFFEVGDTIEIKNAETRPKKRKEGTKWIESGGTEEWLTAITVFKK